MRQALDTAPGAVRNSIVRMVGTFLLLLVLYAVLPLAGRSGASAVVMLLLGLVVFVALVGRQIKMIIQADHPKLRAVEALALVVPVLVLVFAYTYVSLSDVNPASFTEPISRIDGVYFAVTILGTVGFGDIAAETEAARLIVTLQILIGLVAVVGLARLLLRAADLGLSSRRATEGQLPPERDGADA